MTEDFYNSNRNSEPGHEADETLRLLAELPPPAELTERVHRRLAIERNAQGMPERRGFWSLWMPAQRFQFAAAAVLVVAVAGSTWSVYHSHPRTGAQGGAQSAAPAIPATHGSSPDSAGGFSSANAERVPPTLHPIKVPPAPKKKPGAGHAASKPSPKTLAAQPSGTQADVKPAVNP
jgi:hypothetical protein